MAYVEWRGMRKSDGALAFGVLSGANGAGMYDSFCSISNWGLPVFYCLSPLILGRNLGYCLDDYAPMCLDGSHVRSP